MTREEEITEGVPKGCILTTAMNYHTGKMSEFKVFIPGMKSPVQFGSKEQAISAWEIITRSYEVSRTVYGDYSGYW